MFLIGDRGASLTLSLLCFLLTFQQDRKWIGRYGAELDKGGICGLPNRFFYSQAILASGMQRQYDIWKLVIFLLVSCISFSQVSFLEHFL